MDWEWGREWGLGMRPNTNPQYTWLGMRTRNGDWEWDTWWHLVADCNPLHVKWSISTVSVKCTRKSEPFPRYKLLLQLSSLWCRLPNLHKCPLNCLCSALRNVTRSASSTVPTLYTHDRSAYEITLHYDSEMTLYVVGRQMLTYPPVAQPHRSGCLHLINPALKLHMALVSEWDGVQWYEASYQLEQDAIKQLVNRFQIK